MPPSGIERRTSLDNIFEDREHARIMFRAYEKALSLRERTRVDPDTFTDVYPDFYLARCNEYVDSLTHRFRERDSALKKEKKATNERSKISSTVIEVVANDIINRGILGENIRSIQTAPFDDFANKLDGVIVLFNPERNAYINLGIDYTTSDSNSHLDNNIAAEKMAEIHDDLRVGELSKVAFFESPFETDPHEKGKAANLPKMVAGLSFRHLVQLSEVWINDDIDSIRDSQLPLLLLRQILQQAEVYGTVAKKALKKDVADQYFRAHAELSLIYKAQQKMMGLSMLNSRVSDDAVNKQIRIELGTMM